MTLSEIVTPNLRLMRTQQELSQKTVAKNAKLSVSYISMLKRGQRTPPLERLEVIAKALGVAPTHLLQELSRECDGPG